MATTVSNKASLALFAGRFGYAPFRRPVLLGRPVHARRLPLKRHHRVFQLQPALAAAAYARLLPPQDTEFLPADMPALLAHKLTLGTFVAIEGSDHHTATTTLRTTPGHHRTTPWMRVPSAPCMRVHPGCRPCRPPRRPLRIRAVLAALLAILATATTST
jgi:hypothetical protein